jgi:hypothetical protein
VAQQSCLLQDKKRTIAEKAFLIKTYVLSAALYGGEWFGMNQTQTSLIQKEVDKALFLAIGAGRGCKTICPVRLSWELGVPSVAAACAAARYRIYSKSASMNTDASEILNSRTQGGKKKTWASITQAETGKAIAAVWQKNNQINPSTNPEDESKDLAIPPMVIKGLKAQAQEYPKKIPKTWTDIHGNDDAAGTIQNEMIAVKAYQWAKEMTQHKLQGPISQMDYEKYEYGLTRNFHKAALRYPYLKDGVLTLLKARLGVLPLASSAYEARENTNSLSATAQALGKSACPLCKQTRRTDPTEEDEITHILLNCKALRTQRDEHLKTIITKLRRTDEVRNSGEINEQDKKVATYLLGGSCSASGPIVGSLNQILRKMNPRNRFIYLWRHGYGNITGIQPENMALYGFVPVARFLKSTFGSYQKAIDDLYAAPIATNAYGGFRVSNPPLPRPM